MFELFFDIFARGDNALSRLDARAKLIVALVAIMAVLLSTHVLLPLALLGLCLGATLAVRVPAKLVALRLLGPMGVVLVVVILQSFMVGATPLRTISVAGLHLTAFVEGARLGMLIGSRVLGAVSVMLLLSAVTPAHAIFQSLRWFGISRGWTEIALLTYRYVFALADDASDVAAAQRLRLGYFGVRRALQSFGTLAGTVIVRSLDQAESTHEAMVLRGYSGYMPFGPMASMSRLDRQIMLLAPLALVLALVLLERSL